jgi:hypothetical protein
MQVTMNHPAAQTIQNVALLTHLIEEHEAQTEWDGAKLASLYNFRLKEITQALRNGATLEELAAITGNGGN